MPGEGRGLSSGPTQDVVRDLEIGQPSNSEKRSEGLAWAIVHRTAHPWLSLGAGVAALVALRGCPMCWTVGLVETLSQGRRDSTIR